MNMLKGHENKPLHFVNRNDETWEKVDIFTVKLFTGEIGVIVKTFNKKSKVL